MMMEEMDSNNISYQLTPAGNHGRNAAERAIQTFKNHFVAGLCSVHPRFPLHQWDKLLPQAELTLNLLRPSRLNPALSAHATLYGILHYSTTPLAPPGIRVLAHDLPSQRKSWAPHASEGFYLGPALNHYRCYRVWNVRTQSERVSETVRWLPHNHISVPTPTPDDLLLASIQDLHQLIHKSKPQQLPLLSSTGIRLLLYLKTIFKCPPPRVEPSSPHPVRPFPPPRVEPSSPPRERLSPPP